MVGLQNLQSPSSSKLSPDEAMSQIIAEQCTSLQDKRELFFSLKGYL